MYVGSMGFGTFVEEGGCKSNYLGMATASSSPLPDEADHRTYEAFISSFIK